MQHDSLSQRRQDRYCLVVMQRHISLRDHNVLGSGGANGTGGIWRVDIPSDVPWTVSLCSADTVHSVQNNQLAGFIVDSSTVFVQDGSFRLGAVRYGKGGSPNCNAGNHGIAVQIKRNIAVCKITRIRVCCVLMECQQSGFRSAGRCDGAAKVRIRGHCFTHGDGESGLRCLCHSDGRHHGQYHDQHQQPCHGSVK